MEQGRLEASGSFGAVASTHWLASQAAMATLEKGGNAFDAAVVAGFVMQVAQPHLNGPAGDAAILVHDASTGHTTSVCGQGPTPSAATLDRFRELELDLIPGTGLLPAVVPGAFDAWMLVLADLGTIGLRDALTPAIEVSEKGVPVDERLHETLQAAVPVFRQYWPTSAKQYFPDGVEPPELGAPLLNPTLGSMWRRLVEEAEKTASDRTGRIEAARSIWSDGFIAEAVGRFCEECRVMDVSGHVNGALLRGSDLSGWRASMEPTVSTEFAGRRVFKCGAWSQGPVLLQALNLIDPSALRDLDPESSEFVHRLAEALKLALADRDAHYGLSGSDQPDRAGRRLDHLLSASYAAARRELIADSASHAFRPGSLLPEADALGHWTPDYEAASTRQREAGLLAAYGGGEPTVVYSTNDPQEQTDPDAPNGQILPEQRSAYNASAVGDTTYICVADSAGNVVSATPSGGWLQSSPVIPELGFCLGTRAQMMWLDGDAPSALEPDTRPRSTLTPTIVTGENGDVLAVGTPGGDQQEQWQFAFLIRHLAQGMSMQEALDAPGFHTNHVVNSFYPRGAIAGSLVVESRFPADTLNDLRERGHDVTVVGDWVEGRLCAVTASSNGERRAAVSRRGGQALAVAR